MPMMWLTDCSKNKNAADQVERDNLEQLDIKSVYEDFPLGFSCILVYLIRIFG